MGRAEPSAAAAAAPGAPAAATGPFLGKVVEMKSLSLVLALGASTALATTLLLADVPRLTRSSDVIVRGTVVRVQARLSGDGARIFTEAELAVAEALKGAPGPSLIASQPGGVVGEVGQWVDGVATFREGDEVVLFLERRGPHYTVTGMAQGLYRVDRPAGAAALAVPQAAHAELVDPATGKSGARDERPVPLEALLQQVRGLVREGDGAPGRVPPALAPPGKVLKTP